ncbi:MAG: hypothetical protein CVU64_13030 [Deltaproteobacteria bacterium HGW-Deltaproteobacteria-21]|nr:MAG: hypothetical protein CVU64_13030 [Deltaproteobacteria bacterium HGW-Deltaproteobacteria-21]
MAVSPAIEKMSPLCVLCASAVKNLTPDIGMSIPAATRYGWHVPRWSEIKLLELLFKCLLTLGYSLIYV